MKDTLPEFIQELLWRRNRTEAEQARLVAWLAEHPEAGDLLDLDHALNRALDELPQAPLPSNFTALVMQEIERGERAETRGQDRPRAPWRWLANWLPRAAVAGVILGVAALGYHQHQVALRAELAQSMAESVAVLSPEVFVNFDAVQHAAAVVPDSELLNALE